MREKKDMLNFTVGPVMASDEICRIGAEQVPYFRTDEFSKIMKENETLVKRFSVPLFTIKKLVELPLVRRISRASPVDCAAPGEVMLTFVAAVDTPRPICMAFFPPVVAVAAVAPDVV